MSRTAHRFRCAKKLLGETSLQVSEVAAECGYKFTAHFRKIFRAETGMNPLAWRKAARDKDASRVGRGHRGC